MTDLDANLKRLYRDRPALARNAGLHLALWFFGALEIWVALKFMGEPVTAAKALVIESLSLAMRSATFVMPASLGVQEGAMIAVCAVFGLGAPAALALSLSKRAAELVVGLVGLITWQFFERAVRQRRLPEALEGRERPALDRIRNRPDRAQPLPWNPPRGRQDGFRTRHEKY